LGLAYLVTTDVVDVAFPLSADLNEFLVAALTDVDAAANTMSSIGESDSG
jgi:hypothetical protein